MLLHESRFLIELLEPVCISSIRPLTYTCILACLVYDNFDKALKGKGLGEDYFRKKKERLKEMELEHELHEFAIDEMLDEEN